MKPLLPAALISRMKKVIDRIAAAYDLCFCQLMVSREKYLSMNPNTESK